MVKLPVVCIDDLIARHPFVFLDMLITCDGCSRIEFPNLVLICIGWATVDFESLSGGRVSTQPRYECFLSSIKKESLGELQAFDAYLCTFKNIAGSRQSHVHESCGWNDTVSTNTMIPQMTRQVAADAIFIGH